MAGFDWPGWITAVATAATAGLAAVGIWRQSQEGRPEIECTAVYLDGHGIVQLKVAVARFVESTIVISAAKLKRPRNARLGLESYYPGIQRGPKFDLPFHSRKLEIEIEVRPAIEIQPSLGPVVFDGPRHRFALYVDPAGATGDMIMSIALLVSIKSRPTRKRWQTIISSIRVPKTPAAEAN